MPSTKDHAEVSAGVTLTAGAGDTTIASQDNTTSYGGAWQLRLTNGATGPTVPAQIQIQVSPDDTEWFDLGGPLVAGTANDGVYEWTVVIDHAFQYTRGLAGSNTGQDVTLQADYSKMTHNR